MKVTLNWLKQYVDFNWTPEELSERLTMLGLEVEGVEKRAGEFEGIVVAQVLTRDKHPNADKLSVCRVNDGRGERQIVCGAQNFQAGDKVPLILPGAALPPKPGETQPFVIKVGKIRSVESHGMMCSHEELGIDPEAIGHRKEDGLLILKADAVVGQPFAEYLGRAGADVVYDLEITPNRPDLNSVIGIAREIAALTGNALRLPDPVLPSGAGGPKVDELVAVQMEATDACPRYTARVLQGVRVGPSPDWLKSRLEQVGLRSINNVVDVTNFVMIETGQPLHAFDYHLVGKSASGVPTVVVRRATAGEGFTTLDGTVRKLDETMLLIADPQKGIALAGVMGGQNTEIKADTQDVLLESAWFHPTQIRRTSKALGLRTDASYRFERGADIGVAEFASRRAAALILELAGGVVVEGVVDAYPSPAAPKEVTLRHRRVKEVLGIDLRPEEIECHLQQLGLKLASRKPRPVDAEGEPEPVTFLVPSYRVDIKREVDLIEEVARLHGVDRIPSTTPRRAMGEHPYDAVYDVLMEIRRLMAGLGLSEAQGQTLVNDAVAKLVTPNVVALANPLSSDMNVLRPSLLPGLLDTLRHNLSRRSNDVQLFELGRVFTATDAGPKEGWRLAIALTGARSPAFWSGADRDARCDASDLKGLVEEFMESLGLRGVSYVRRGEPGSLFIESAAVALGGKLELGQLGQVQPSLARRYDLRDPVFLAELNLDLLLAKRNPARSFKPLPAFPASARDVAIVVPEATTHDAVLAVVRQAKPANLESVDLFDVFRGRNVLEGHKSMAYSFTYRAADRTLKDEEVNAAHQRVVDAFKTTLKATMRE
jgi:phenylalanyl-tRNA synthetase beta chain